MAQCRISIALQADGKILVGGDFTTIGGQTRNNIARLDATTGLADSFNPNANDTVSAIAVQADGKILVGGYFNGTNIGGQTRNCIARLDPTTGLADSFDPNANGIVYAIAVQADGKILVGGVFAGQTASADSTRNYIARLDPTTGLADSFNPNAGTLGRTRVSMSSRCRRTARFWRAAVSPTSADKSANASPGSIPRPDWLIPSIQTQSILSRVMTVV